MAVNTSGSAEFTTWVALAFAAGFAGLCAIFSTSLLFLIPAAIVGGVLGFLAERWVQSRLSRYLAEKETR